MPISRDWFKRHLEMLAQAIGSAIAIKKTGDIQAAIASIEESVRRTFGMDARLALGLPLAEFLNLAFRGEEPSLELLAEMARLFEEWAELLKTAGREAEAAAAVERAAACRAFKP